VNDLSAPAIAIGQEVNKYSPDLASIRFSTATYGKVVPIGWGQFRLASNLIWSGLFAQESFNVAPSVYTATIIYGVCEGPIAAFGRAWAGQSFYQTFSALPANRGVLGLLGTYSQNPVSFLTSGFPSQALSYRGQAYVAAQNLGFGQGAGHPAVTVSMVLSLPNVNFEATSTIQVGSVAALAKTFTASPSTLSSTGHGFTEFQNIRLSTTGTLPGGLLAGVDYACANVAANTFQLKINPWDANAIIFSGAGTGTHTATPYVLDANPKDVLVDFLTNVNYGAGFPSAQIADLTAFLTYCKASGTFISPVLETPEPAGSFLERLAAITCSGIFFSENLLKIVPYCDTAITGNGVTFTPNVTAVYPLTDDDFKPESGDDPVIVERRDPADAFNSIKIEFENRFNQYSRGEPVEARDEAALGLYGYRPKDLLTLHEIKDPAVAKWVAAFLLFREQAVANTYKFRLPAKYLLLEPMDLLTLTETTGTPLVNVPVRITEVSEEADGFISVVAEDFPIGIAIGVRYPNQITNLGYAQNYNASPGSVNAPVMFVGPYMLTDGAFELWLGLSGGPEYGGCDIWMSFDDSAGPYVQAGRIAGKAITGVTTSSLPIVADPDNSTTLGVNLAESLGSLFSVNAAQAANGVSLCYVGGELLAYTTAAPTGTNLYDLTALRRGRYGSSVLSVASGGRFLFIGTTVFRLPFAAEFDGRTVYFKFLAFNRVGAAGQALADVSPYSVVLTQTFTGLPAPTNFALASGTAELLRQGDGTIVPRIKLTWVPVSSSAVLGYEIQFKPSSDSIWLNAPAVSGQSAARAWIVGARDGVNYDVRIRAFGPPRAFSDWVTIANHFVIGKTAKPSDVGALAFTDPILSWPPVTDDDLAGYIVRYQPSGSNDWATATPAHDQGFITETEFNTHRIIGDLTRLLLKSVDTTGNDATTATTIMVDLRPATPTSFLISVQPDGTREFNLTTAAPPSDLDGARIRYFLGTTSDWAAMTPLHTGLLKAFPFETNQLAAGTYTFAAKNVDEAGNESAAAIFITTVTIGDPRIAGSIEDLKEEPTWTGTKTDCSLDGATGWLVADSSGTWSSLPSTWDAWNSWIGTPKSPITYVRLIDIGVVTTFTPLVTTIVDGSQTIEEQHSDDGSGYSSYAVVGPQLTARYIRIRVTVTGAFPKIKAERIILSAATLTEIIEDLDTSTLTGSYDLGVGNVRLPITKPFDIVKKVDVTLQSVGPGWSWELIDKNVSPGPQIKIYNGVTPADALVDATVTGV